MNLQTDANGEFNLIRVYVTNMPAFNFAIRILVEHVRGVFFRRFRRGYISSL